MPGCRWFCTAEGEQLERRGADLPHGHVHDERLVVGGDEAPPKDLAYVSRNDVPENVRLKPITWGRPIDESQAQAIQGLSDQLSVGLEQSAAGDARPLPRSNDE